MSGIKFPPLSQFLDTHWAQCKHQFAGAALCGPVMRDLMQ
jgi:hypothetical protein